MTELLAPAGDFETALAAFDAGADAVYCGLSDFSARAFATNFSIEQLKDLVRYAHAARTESAPYRMPLRVYVTFNTVIDEANLEEAIERLSRLEQTGIDAIIVQDLGVARICRKFFPGLTLHASTQLVAHNLEGVLALREIGFTRVVLARELSLAEITQIKQRCGDVELEVFIHGALCYSISGLCLYGAMEKGRSGNRGKCPYCCRQKVESAECGVQSAECGVQSAECRVQSAECGVQSAGKRSTSLYPFSMKDLRLGDGVRKLADLGVASLKIEGRMKSPLYVATVTRWYRQFLERSEELRVKNEELRKVNSSDLETVFSRRTTELRFNANTSNSKLQTLNSSPIDASSLGHIGTPVGKVKKVTRDREGKAWLRFHTMRALEKHDGLQFESLTDEGRHFGFGIQEMRQAISRVPVFVVAAGTDVEILMPENIELTDKDGEYLVRNGDTVYCSMSNAVKRMFPVPSFRSSDYPGFVKVDVEVGIEAERIYARANVAGPSRTDASVQSAEVGIGGNFESAKNPEKTFASVEKAFSKLGETDYALGGLKLVDPGHRFAPMSVLNDLRRDLVERLNGVREQSRQAKVDDAIDSLAELPTDGGGTPSLPACGGVAVPSATAGVRKTIKLRPDQPIPAGDWDEIIVAVNANTNGEQLTTNGPVRLALPVWTGELDFNKLRAKVKSLIREGFAAWECSDLATLRLLKSCGVADISADWTLYAFNSSALAELAEKGVRRFVASPENCRENLRFLAESGHAFEFLKQQSTPLFISLHQPAAEEVDGLLIFQRDRLWITTKAMPRSFDVPEGCASRIDLSWDAPQ